MMFPEPLSQYEEILKDAIRTSMKESGAKLAKTFQTLHIDGLEGKAYSLEAYAKALKSQRAGLQIWNPAL